ncbi:hypothetical protein BH23BAC3_BH23BAC3_15430 [soil metagenome]
MHYLKSCSLIYCLIFLSACDEQTVDPIEDDSGIYSFYGTLQVGKSPNYVRVRNLNEPFLADSDFFDGTVTFENLQTGIVSTLRDTVVAFGQNFTHNFIIEDDILHDTSYLLKAERSDGFQSQSIAKTPNITEVNLSPSTNITCRTDIEFVFGNVVAPERIGMKISAEYNGDTHTNTLFIFIEELTSIDGSDEVRIRLSPHNLLVEVFTPILPDNPSFDPYRLNPTVGCGQLDTNEIQITYIHYGPEWSIGSPFRGPIDTESGDVKDGLGFFGAYSEETFTITIETNTVGKTN